MKKKKVLIVDDELDLAEAVKTALVDEGYEVHIAPDGKAGLMAALELKPDLIFLDIIMPEMDGIKMLKELRQDEWGKKADVIVMTVVDDMNKIAEVLEDGSEGYILKSDVTLQKVVEKAKRKLSS